MQTIITARQATEGIRMTTLSKREQDRYRALAARAEDERYAPVEQMERLASRQSTTSEELDDLVRDVYALPASTTPAGATEGRATEGDLQEIIALGGAKPEGSP